MVMISIITLFICIPWIIDSSVGKVFLCKHQDLSLHFQCPHRSWAWWPMCLTQWQRSGGSWIPGIYWSPRLAKSELQVQGQTFSENIGQRVTEERYQISTFGIHVCFHGQVNLQGKWFPPTQVCSCTYACICGWVYVCAQICKSVFFFLNFCIKMMIKLQQK